MPGNLLGVAPWVIIAAIVSWFASIYVHREKAKKENVEHKDRLEVHRDELMFQLLTSARLEMSSARTEVEDLRDENKKLRSMENHFFHFQQSLDHLEALLMAVDAEARALAERNALAFLNRMRRLQEAKGTLTNEVQRAESEIVVLGEPGAPSKDTPDADG